jgi:hypothetical protein
MNSRPPWDVPAADADDGTRSPAGARRGGHLIAVTLLAAAALDLARCGLVLVTFRHPLQAAGLVAAGLAAAALSMWAARGYWGGRRWSGWVALLIGAASGPQAAASGFHAPYTIPDTATAVLGVLLAVAVLATAGQDSQTGNHPPNPVPHQQASHPMTRRSQAGPAQAGALHDGEGRHSRRTPAAGRPHAGALLCSSSTRA